MINCDFVNASSFKLKTSNRAKLLYFFMLSNADDKGFVDNADELIELLDSNDRKLGNDSNMTLMPDNFETALDDLIEKGLLYKFEDRHNNKIYLIKHWSSLTIVVLSLRVYADFNAFFFLSVVFFPDCRGCEPRY